MLFRVIWKNFKSGLKSYLLFFFSEILSVALIFSFYAMKSTVAEWADQGSADVYMVLALRVTGYAVIAAGIFMVVFSMKYYMKARFRDYSLFLILGMKKKMVRQMIAAEYLIGWAISLIAGLLLGNGVQILFKFAVRGYYGGKAVTLWAPLEVYKYTLLISALMILCVLIVIAMLLEERGISNLLNAEVKRERRPVKKQWLLAAMAGILIWIVSILLMNRLGVNYFNENGTYSLAGCMIGGALILLFGGSVLLEHLRKKEGYYYRNLISLNQLYHRFSSNMMMIVVLFAIQIITISYLAVNVADNMPVTQPEEKYPYDFLWFAREEDQTYAKDLAEKYHGSVWAYPTFRATWQWGEENIGISQETYERVTGKTLKTDLSGMEIYYVSQTPARERLVTEYAKKGKLPADLHIGALR